MFGKRHYLDTRSGEVAFSSRATKMESGDFLGKKGRRELKIQGEKSR